VCGGWRHAAELLVCFGEQDPHQRLLSVDVSRAAADVARDTSGVSGSGVYSPSQKPWAFSAHSAAVVVVVVGIERRWTLGLGIDGHSPGLTRCCSWRQMDNPSRQQDLMTTGDKTALDESLVQQWIARLLDAFNAHDLDRLVAVGSDDVVFDHSASPTTMRGHAEVRSFYAANHKAFPDGRIELEDGPFLHPRSPKASFVLRFIGTNTGPIDALGLAPTGKRVEGSDYLVVEFRGELACRIPLMSDMADFLGQLGLHPPPPAELA
jgi:predicted ester cyclase